MDKLLRLDDDRYLVILSKEELLTWHNTGSQSNWFSERKYEMFFYTPLAIFWRHNKLRNLHILAALYAKDHLQGTVDEAHLIANGDIVIRRIGEKTINRLKKALEQNNE